MFTQLLASRRFAPIFWCQFFAALNDNFVKIALALLVVYKFGAETGEMLGQLAGIALVAPFVIFSAIGGEIADRFDKAKVVHSRSSVSRTSLAKKSPIFELGQSQRMLVWR